MDGSMDMIVAFRGRGVDSLSTDEAHLPSLLYNLAEGLTTGRVRWFLVAGAGALSDAQTLVVGDLVTLEEEDSDGRA